MLTLIVATLLLFILFSAIALQKVYKSHTPIEIKRRAQAGDDFYKNLYKVTAYKNSLEILLWSTIGLSASGFLVIVSSSLSRWLALLVALLVIWVAFAWMPNTRTSVVAKTTARYFVPPFSWLIARLYPVLSFIERQTAKYVTVNKHTKIYQRDDLLDLLEKQKSQPDNRMGKDELKVVAGALTFGEKLVRDVMTPKRAVKIVNVTDAIGPHLMDELHGSGHSRFPVYQDKKDNIVGILYMHDLFNIKDGGQVRSVMNRKLYYVHEGQTLNQALKAFLKTKHHLHIVVNEFEEIVGILTIEDILEQILGSPIVDEFDKYDDLRAVAAMHAKSEHEQHVANENKK